MKVVSIDLHIDYIDNMAFDICYICHSSLYSTCSNCTSVKECKSILGRCGHYYHYHCMELWEKTPRRGICKCPLDRKPWIPVLKKIENREESLDIEDNVHGSNTANRLSYRNRIIETLHANTFDNDANVNGEPS